MIFFKNLPSASCQVGNQDIAKLVCDMIMTDKYGTYHVTNEGFCSWYDFAKKIFEINNIDIKVNTVTSSYYKVF